jgi:putative transposase
MEQTTAILEHARESGLGTALVMHDRDTKFTQSFDDALKTGGVRVQKAAPRSPNTCAFVERFIQTLQQECLDYFVAFGEKHMNYLVSEMVAHYHEERPHQGKENELLIRGSSEPSTKRTKSRPPPNAAPLGDI